MTNSPEKHYDPENYIKNGMVEFAKTGMNLLFLAHGAAIIALLANLEKVKGINLTFGSYFWYIVGSYTSGLVLVFITIFAAYMCHFNLTHDRECEVINGKRFEKKYFRLSLAAAVLSLIVFIVTSFFAIYLATGMNINFIFHDIWAGMAILFSLLFLVVLFWDIK